MSRQETVLGGGEEAAQADTVVFAGVSGLYFVFRMLFDSGRWSLNRYFSCAVYLNEEANLTLALIRCFATFGRTGGCDPPLAFPNEAS